MILEFEFDKKIENFLKLLSKTALLHNVRLFFVGGFIRDKILNIKSKDIDFIVAADAIEFSQYLPPQIKIKSTHPDFRTVKVEYDSYTFDIASTREEHYPYSGCLPVVDKIAVSLENDVKRRDFTINSLYCEIKYDDKLRYELIDLVNGVNDIKSKTLKVLHDKSYIDDPTRILRGLNFKHRFNFEISRHDEKLIQNYMQNINYSNMSYDRTKAVFKYIFLNKSAISIFEDVIKNKYYKILKPQDLSLNIEKIKNIITDFSLNQDQTAQFLTMIIENAPEQKQNFSKKSDVQKYFSKLPPENLGYYFYKIDDENALLYLKMKDIKLFLNGDILQSLGYQKGKLIGEILDNLLNEKITNPQNFMTLNDEKIWVFKNYPQ